MKIAYITDVGIEGGATKSLLELVSTQANIHAVEPVVFSSRKSILNRELDAMGIENHAVGHGAFLQSAPNAKWKRPIKYLVCLLHYYLHYFTSEKRAIESTDWTSISIVHTNIARNDLGIILSRRFNTVNICHLREFAELDFECWSYRPRYVNYLNKNVDFFIAISHAVKNYWVGKGLDEEKVKVIYNGVDCDNIVPVNKSTWERDVVIQMVIVGGVIKNKGQWQAIQAMCCLPHSVRKNIRLDIIGRVNDSYKRKLEKQLLRAGALEQVRFLGNCDNVNERLQHYHIGLMCSLSEGFGRVTVEYMHAGLAVIATRSGANPEIIDEQVNGLLYDCGNTYQLAECIERYYHDRKAMLDYSNRGTEKARKLFTKEKNAKEIYAQYEQLLRINSDG